MDLLGFDPGTIGFEGAASSALSDPSDSVQGLFRSMAPFEAEETERATIEQAGQFGQLGGRFSRGAVDADTRLRGRMSAEFGRNREAALLQAGQQRNQALAALLNSVANAGQIGNQQMGQFLQFLQPGAPNFQEGIAGDILGAAGTAAGMYFGGPAGAALGEKLGSSVGGGRAPSFSSGRGPGQGVFGPPPSFGSSRGAPAGYAPMIPDRTGVYEFDPRLFGTGGIG